MVIHTSEQPSTSMIPSEVPKNLLNTEPAKVQQCRNVQLAHHQNPADIYRFMLTAKAERIGLTGKRLESYRPEFSHFFLLTC
jgi:hypothetical protein